MIRRPCPVCFGSAGASLASCFWFARGSRGIGHCVAERFKAGAPVVFFETTEAA